MLRDVSDLYIHNLSFVRSCTDLSRKLCSDLIKANIGIAMASNGTSLVNI